MRLPVFMLPSLSSSLPHRIHHLSDWYLDYHETFFNENSINWIRDLGLLNDELCEIENITMAEIWVFSSLGCYSASKSIIRCWIDIKLVSAVSICHLKHSAKISKWNLEIKINFRAKSIELIVRTVYRYMKDIDEIKEKRNLLVYSEWSLLFFRLNTIYLVLVERKS